MKPLSKRMPSVTSSSRPKVLDSSTVTTPSWPTFSRASAMKAPICSSAAEMEAVAAISSWVSTSLASASRRSTTAATAFSIPRRTAIGLAPAATLPQALAHQGLGQDGGGGGAVARDVVGLLGDLLDELGADLLVGLLELDLLGDGHAVVGDRGGAPLLVEHDVTALGAQGDLDGVGEGVEAALHAAAGLLVEGDDLGH